MAALSGGHGPGGGGWRRLAQSIHCEPGTANPRRPTTANAALGGEPARDRNLDRPRRLSQALGLRPGRRPTCPAFPRRSRARLCRGWSSHIAGKLTKIDDLPEQSGRLGAYLRASGSPPCSISAGAILALPVPACQGLEKAGFQADAAAHLARGASHGPRERSKARRRKWRSARRSKLRAAQLRQGRAPRPSP